MNFSGRILACALGLVSLAACASPPIKQEYRREAQKDVTIASVQQDPARYNGTQVIWGGRIIETTPQRNGTEIVILEMPLDSQDMPVNPQGTRGRFIARSATFLDPVLYQKGRYVTIAGKFSGTETRPIGQTQYAYPVVSIDQPYLWDTSTVLYRGYEPYYDGPAGFFNWGWGWGGTLGWAWGSP